MQSFQRKTNLKMCSVSKIKLQINKEDKTVTEINNNYFIPEMLRGIGGSTYCVLLHIIYTYSQMCQG